VRNISEFPSPKERGENVLGIQKYFEYGFLKLKFLNKLILIASPSSEVSLTPLLRRGEFSKVSA